MTDTNTPVTAMDLKDQVRRALNEEWPAFAQAHPLLSAAIDLELLVEQAADSLADDVDYRRAMEQAQSTGGAIDAAVAVIANAVKALIRSLT
jgi:hypothetical protein